MFASLFKLLRGEKPVPALNDRGRVGETRAAEYLESKGLRILARNWRCSFGEIDIIAKAGENIVFVEVKSAGHRSDYKPEDRVNHEKQRRIKRLARAFLKSQHMDKPTRFDIVTVIWDDGGIKIEHFENAFL